MKRKAGGCDQDLGCWAVKLQVQSYSRWCKGLKVQLWECTSEVVPVNLFPPIVRAYLAQGCTNKVLSLIISNNSFRFCFSISPGKFSFVYHFLDREILCLYHIVVFETTCIINHFDQLLPKILILSNIIVLFTGPWPILTYLNGEISQSCIFNEEPWNL